MKHFCPICNGELVEKDNESLCREFWCDKFPVSHLFINRVDNGDIVKIKCRVDNVVAVIDYLLELTTIHINVGFLPADKVIISRCVTFDFSDPESFKRRVNSLINLS